MRRKNGGGGGGGGGVVECDYLRWPIVRATGSFTEM